MGKVEVDIRLSIIIFSYYPETKINRINCALYYINHDKLKLIVIFKYIIFGCNKYTYQIILFLFIL